MCPKSSSRYLPIHRTQGTHEMFITVLFGILEKLEYLTGARDDKINEKNSRQVPNRQVLDEC